mmetsp:Transcript_17761/g.46357  ORF Transcript_17761/g.46357 Transcript_17761/m.46357 type:complete len:248 (-) Transcript_17761:12-755(-)
MPEAPRPTSPMFSTMSHSSIVAPSNWRKAPQRGWGAVSPFGAKSLVASPSEMALGSPNARASSETWYTMAATAGPSMSTRWASSTGRGLPLLSFMLRWMQAVKGVDARFATRNGGTVAGVVGVSRPSGSSKVARTIRPFASGPVGLSCLNSTASSQKMPPDVAGGMRYRAVHSSSEPYSPNASCLQLCRRDFVLRTTMNSSGDPSRAPAGTGTINCSAIWRFPGWATSSLPTVRVLVCWVCGGAVTR